MYKNIFFRRTCLSSAIAALAIVVSLIAGCNTEVLDEVFDTYLTIDTSLEANAPENLAVYTEARRRMDQYVFFNDGQWLLRSVTANRLAMSEELFSQMKSAMQQSNDVIKDYRYVQVRKNVIRLAKPGEVIPLNPLRTRSFTENFPPNSSGVDYCWWGYDMYLSHEDLMYISFGAAITSGVSRLVALFPPASVPAGVIGGYASIVAAIYGLTAYNCQNGAIFSYSWIGGFLFDISCQ